jgi:hypothetical protein
MLPSRKILATKQPDSLSAVQGAEQWIAGENLIVTAKN